VVSGGTGPVVVVTTMPLSADARADLSELLGPDYVILDVKKAPTSANIVLTTVVSERMLESLRLLFPQARILFTELHDRRRDIRYAGPVTRALETGPDGYFVAHGIEALPPIVRSEARLQLSGNTRPTPPVIDSAAPVPTAPPPPGPAPGADQAADQGAVIWREAVTPEPVPAGQWLDRRPVDTAVATLLGTSEPRKSPLWTVMLAKTAVHMARDGVSVVVDVSDLPETTRAQLRLHVGAEQVTQSSWPPR
jgi:hypothetical protein